MTGRILTIASLGLMLQINPANAVVDCLKYGLLSLAMSRGQSCQTLASDKSLKFKSPQDVELLNNKISGFKCLRVKPGQTICYRP